MNMRVEQEEGCHSAVGDPTAVETALFERVRETDGSSDAELAPSGD